MRVRSSPVLSTESTAAWGPKSPRHSPAPRSRVHNGQPSPEGWPSCVFWLLWLILLLWLDGLILLFGRRKTVVNGVPCSNAPDDRESSLPNEKRGRTNRLSGHERAGTREPSRHAAAAAPRKQIPYAIAPYATYQSLGTSEMRVSSGTVGESGVPCSRTIAFRASMRVRTAVTSPLVTASRQTLRPAM